MISAGDVWEFLPKLRLKRLAYLVTTSVFLLLGFLDFFTNHGANKCDMTYMFERPEYVPVKLNESVRRSFPQYNLFVYGEGRYARELEGGKFDGIPVIFIPGNAGSYRQVRSLASVCLRKQYDKGLRHGFDFFAIDFNEEFSAFYGKLLYDQTRYLHVIVKSVLGLYGGRRQNVILIGHSMGGLIARALFGLPDFDKKRVHILISLASPHSAPVAVPDALVADFYQEVEDVWTEGMARGNLSHVSVVSITGGFRDVQVWSGLGRPKGVAEEALISTVSTAVPDVWVGTDHLCIVWCKQLVLAISRALFDLIDAGSRRIITDVGLTRQILNYHLRTRSGGKSFRSSFHPPVVTMDKDAYWWEVVKRRWSFRPEDLQKKTYVAVPLYKDVDYEAATVVVTNHREKDWIFACKMIEVHKMSKVCSEGTNLSNRGAIVPGQVKRKLAHLDLAPLRAQNFTHILFLHPGFQSMAIAYGDVHSKEERVIEVSPSYWLSYLEPTRIIRETERVALMYRIIFKSAFENPSKAYNLIVETLSCKATPAGSKFTGWVEFGVPHYEDSVFEPLRSEPGLVEKFKAKLQSTSTRGSGMHPEAKLVLNPDCVYSVKFSAAFEETLGQMWRLYSPQLPAYVAVVLLTGFIGQVQALASEGRCPSFSSACCSVKGILFIVLPYRILSYVFMSPGLADWLPETDVSTLHKNNLDTVVLPFLMYCAAVPLVYLLSCVSWLLVIVCGSALHQLTLRVFSKITRVKEPISEIAVEGLAKFPGIVVVLLLAVGHATCGAFALLLGVVYYYVKVFQYYEEFVESLVAKSVGLAVRSVRDRLASRASSSGANPAESPEGDVRRGSASGDLPDEGNSGDVEENSDDSQPQVGSGVSDGDAVQNGSADGGEEEEESLASLINVKARFHLGVLMIWLVALCVNVPSVLSWMARFKFAVRLDPDPSAMTGFLVLATAVVIWQGNVPHLRRANFFISPKCLRVLGVAMLLYGSVSSYRLGPFLGLSLIWLALHERWSKKVQPS